MGDLDAVFFFLRNYTHSEVGWLVGSHTWRIIPGIVSG